ncbi:peptidase inhibitor family I36 protein [Streptomyces sp. F63]|uniref:peptidase inhibitor family I36 protein n=1 Tax=Streptomyces sp. F63 TaxID=2824887 RepID=UPI001B399D31|nr:peptidase inhibitor family I36 protein [Streptomyces sp. F63]MBQ0984174.1 peptidase inhibitor family I36 protein [Streptomyces sp. F63]
MRKIRTTLAVAAATAAAVVALPGTTATAAPTPWESCVSGNVCFFTGRDGTGLMCAWSVADPDWTQGTSKCSWSQTDEVKSVWNRGTSSSFTGVAYYQWKDYNTRKGCTPQGKRGNLAGTYKLKSHQWIKSSCG